MSCRRGDSDFTLQEGGNGTLPPPMPTYGLHPPTAGLCPKTLHLDLVIPPPEGDSIQVLPPAVSFWKRERYRLTHRGRANRNNMNCFASVEKRILIFFSRCHSSARRKRHVQTDYVLTSGLFSFFFLSLAAFSK